MTSSEAYALLRFFLQLTPKVEQACGEFADRRAHPREKQWLADALALLQAHTSEVDTLLDQALLLPDLPEAREDARDTRRSAWVEALEKLLAGFAFHAGRRAPIIEALFPHQKLEPLVRKEELAVTFASEFERRLKTGYVARMLGQEELAFASPVLEQVQIALARWQSCSQPASSGSELETEVRQRLLALAERLELACKQAKLLSEAALAAFPDAFQTAGLDVRPKKRTGTAPPLPPVKTLPEVPRDAPLAPSPKKVPKPARNMKAQPSAKA